MIRYRGCAMFALLSSTTVTLYGGRRAEVKSKGGCRTGNQPESFAAHCTPEDRRERAEKSGRTRLVFSINQGRTPKRTIVRASRSRCDTSRNIRARPRSVGPGKAVTIPQGRHHLLLNEATISQPLTQLIRIHEANRIAAAEVAISRADLKKAENQVAVDVHRLYFAILIAELQKRTAEEQTAYAKQELKENTEGVRNGSLLRVSGIQGDVDVLQGQQAVLTADLQVTDLNTELDDLLGLPLDTKLDLAANRGNRPRKASVRGVCPGRLGEQS